MKTEHNRSRDTGTVDLWEIIHLFRYNIGKILFCVAAALGLSGFYLAHVKPTYASSALLEAAAPQDQANTPPDASDLLKTIELKIASQSVLLDVIKKNQLAQDPDFAPPRNAAFSTADLSQWLETKTSGFLRWSGASHYIDTSVDESAGGPYSDTELIRRLAAKVSVSLVRGSRLISLTVEDHDPQKAQRLAQSVIDEFFQQSWNDRSQDLATARQLLLAEVRRVSGDLRESEEKLEAYREKYNAVSLQERQNIVVERLRELNQQVLTAQNTRLGMQPEADRVRHDLETDPMQLLSVRGIAELQEIIDVRKAITTQEAQIATLAKRYGPLHPTMVQAQSQLENLRASLRANLQKAGQRILQSYAAAQDTESALKAALDEQQKASLELGRIAIPYHNLEREVQANSSLYQKVLDNLKQLDVTHKLMTSNEVNGTRIHVVAPPLAPIKPVRPRTKLILAISSVVGLFLGCGLALIARALDNTISSVDAAESALGLSVLTTVPLTRQQRLSARPVVLKQPASAEAESFRSLRTSLSLLAEEDDRRFILVTSAVPGEGKSYCSLNMAAAFAQQGLPTLLIDGDLRRPTLRRLLSDWSDAPGLSDCIANPDLFSHAAQPTRIDHLFCLGDRKGHPGSAELLGRDGMHEILQRSRENFERIVIDTAPLLAVSDTLYIAKNVPTICLVVSAGNTPRRMVRRAMKLLDEVARRAPIGVILNKARHQAAAHHYYYYTAATRAA